MKSRSMHLVRAIVVVVVLACGSAAWGQPLPSWKDGPVKARILAFVRAVADQTGKDFVPPAERIAVFDNDGTLWADKFIGRRPVLAFGNSDGDHEMLLWTAAGTGPRFMGIVHHTDAERAWAYDRTSRVGRLDRALDDANAKGWTVVDMKAEWKKVFAFE